MPSPDVAPYIDLTLLDRGPDELLGQALARAAQVIPEWAAAPGDSGTAILEAQSVIAAEQVYAVNRLPGATVQTLLALFGIARNTGLPPKSTVTFTLSDTLGHQIPAGTRLRLLIGSPMTATPVDFTTDAAAAANAGQSTTTTVGITGTSATDIANAVPSGTALQLVDAIPYVDRIVTASAVAGGSFDEADVDYFARAMQVLSRLVTTLVRPQHFVAAALTTAGVSRAFAIDNYNADTATANAPGYVAVAVYGAAGPLSAADKNALQVTLSNQAQANLAVRVIDPTVTAVNVTTTVARLPGFDDATVKANVQAALAAYLSPNTWPWSGVVRYNELISLLDRAAGVDYVVSLTAPAADVTLPGVAPLANVGTVTVTTQ